jgi:hypothetical protein
LQPAAASAIMGPPRLKRNVRRLFAHAMIPNDDTPERIRRRVRHEISTLPESLRRWAEEHLKAPTLVRASLDPGGGAVADFWLVTDATGDRDSSALVVYDPRHDSFGLVERIEGGSLWFMGLYGTFGEAVEAM